MRLFFLFCLLVGKQILADNLVWQEDYNVAVEKSRSQNKPILLFFTGSDWSGPCMKMKNEAFNSQEFQSKESDAFVFVEIDFPRHKSLSSSHAEQNEFLKNKYKIEEIPTLLLLDNGEREICRFCYQPENGSQLAKDLNGFVSQDKELQEGLLQIDKDPKTLKKLYELAQNLKQNQIIEALLAEGVAKDDPFFLLETYRMLITSKKTESSALKEKLLKLNSPQIDFTLALIEFQELANDPSKKKSPEAVTRPLVDYLAKYERQNLESVWRIEMMIAETFLEADKWQEAIHHAEMAFKASPIDVKEEISSLITYIEEQQKNTGV